MAKRFIFNKLLAGIVLTLFATTLFAQKPRNISGTLVDSDGNSIVQITVLLLGEDGTEVQRTETSKKRLGRGGGNFEFKKVTPGNYIVETDAGDAGKISSPVEVVDSNVKLGDITLSADVSPPKPETDSEVAPAESPGSNPVAFTPDAGKDYILNEISFEIKKMTAELKYLNEDCLLYTSPSPRDRG